MDQSPANLSSEDERILENVRRHGFITMRVGQSAEDSASRPDWSDVPDWTYTIGLYATYGHPELVAFTLEEEITHAVFWDLAEQIKAGRTFDPGTIYQDALPSFGSQCSFEPVETAWLPELFGYGLWFYLDDLFPVLQYVWPDNVGLFPSHPGASPYLREAQRDLTVAPSAADPPSPLAIPTTTWIGLVHLDGPAGHEALDGGIGAWVNVLGLAGSRGDFDALVRSTFTAEGLEVGEIDNPEPLTDRLDGAAVDDELLGFARGLCNEEPIVFDSFHVYDEND